MADLVDKQRAEEIAGSASEILAKRGSLTLRCSVLERRAAEIESRSRASGSRPSDPVRIMAIAEGDGIVSPLPAAG